MKGGMMPAKKKHFGEEVEDHPLPDKPFRSEGDGYRWGLRVIQAVVGKFHESTLSLKVLPDRSRKGGIEQVRISIRHLTTTFIYCLRTKGQRRVKIIRTMVQDERIVRPF